MRSWTSCNLLSSDPDTLLGGSAPAQDMLQVIPVQYIQIEPLYLICDWLKAFVTTAYGILSHWPKCALKQQTHDGGRLIYMEWRLGPLLLFFSIFFLLPVFKKKYQENVLQSFGFPLRAVAK